LACSTVILDRRPSHCSRIGFTEWPQQNQTLTKVREFSSFPELRKGMTMRILTASVIVAALSFATPAFVQAQGASPQPQAEEAPARSGTVIRSIQVVDIKQLQPEVRAKVEEIVARTSEEDLQSLRKSIDATPEADSALKVKGLTSSQVVAINIADGVLTMIAKTA
jgi:hypothetical protein